MITPNEAQEIILKNLTPLNEETVSVAGSLGRILSRELRAGTDLPPFDNSAMDGYAVISQNLRTASRENPISLSVKKTVRAGGPIQNDMKMGEAVRVMTGAPVPGRSDAVVMKEMVEQVSEDEVRIGYVPKTGENIRSRGEDVKSGDLFLKEGTMIRSYEIALMAAQGITEVPVIGKPKVAFFATGDELVDAGEPIREGQIRNSNGPAMAATFTRWGIQSVDFGIVKDDPALFKARAKYALSEADVLIISGGVSVGDYDFTKSALRELGVEEVFWKVAIKPGKPFWFGLYPSKTPSVKKPVFGIPGNPVSLLVCIEEFVRGALEKLQGRVPRYPGYHLLGKTVNEYSKPRDRQQYLFCNAVRKGNDFMIEIIRPQGSAMVGMACQANALAVAPIGDTHIQEGDTLSFRWLK